MSDQPRRQLRIRFARESTVEIDEERLRLNYGEFATVAKLERALKAPIEEGDASIDNIADAVGVPGRYDKYHDTEIDIEVEEQCEKHGVWYGTNPGSLGYCWECKNEQRAKPAKAMRKT